jgi:hypothetical protein
VYNYTRISKKFGPYVVVKAFGHGTYEISQLDDSASEIVTGNQRKMHHNPKILYRVHL